MMFRDRERQCSFQAGNAESGAFEFDLLFVSGMRGVIGGDGVDGAVGERDDNGFAVGRRAQWGIHLEVGVVFADVLVNQSEVVRRDLAGDAGLGALTATHGLKRVSGREMGYV